MYLHLGQNVLVRQRDIVGIFDIENTTVRPISKSFLRKSQEKGCVINISDNLPKTFIVCHREKKAEVYISQISSLTLRKRAGAMKSFKDQAPGGGMEKG